MLRLIIVILMMFTGATFSTASASKSNPLDADKDSSQTDQTPQQVVYGDKGWQFQSADVKYCR